jgi:hypothetical protein
MDTKRLDDAAGVEGVEDALDSLRRFADRDREPKEIEAWAEAGR